MYVHKYENILQVVSTLDLHLGAKSAQMSTALQASTNTLAPWPCAFLNAVDLYRPTSNCKHLFEICLRWNLYFLSFIHRWHSMSSLLQWHCYLNVPYREIH